MDQPWKAVWDNDHGMYYYYHSETGEVTWDQPEGYVYSEPGDVTQSSETYATITATSQEEIIQDGGWIAVDDGTGQTYYYNPATGETSWDLPVIETALLAPDTSGSFTTQSNWHQAADESGQVYYYNAATGETSWEPPADLVASTANETISSPTKDESMEAHDVDDESVEIEIDYVGEEEDTSRSPSPHRSRKQAIFSTPSPSTSSTKNSPGNSLSRQHSDSSEKAANYSTTRTSTMRTSSTTKPATVNSKGLSIPHNNDPEIVGTSGTNVPTPVSQSQAAILTHSITAAEKLIALSESHAYRYCHPDKLPWEDIKTILKQVSPLFEDFITARFRKPVTTTSGAGDTEAKCSLEERLKSMAFGSSNINNARTLDIPNGFSGEGYAFDGTFSWRPDLLRVSLCKLKDFESNNKAVKLNHLVMGFMGDLKGSKPPMEAAMLLLAALIRESSLELSDEIYCQIAKQLCGNPSTLSAERGWQLMLFCLATIPPSMELAPFLVKFAIHQHECQYNPVLQPMPLKLSQLAAAYIMRAIGLNDTSKMNFVDSMSSNVNNINNSNTNSNASLVGHTIRARKEIPTQVELESIVSGEHCTMKIFFLDHKYVFIPFDSWSTVGSVSLAVANKVGLRPENAQLFSLFEIGGPMDHNNFSGAGVSGGSGVVGSSDGRALAPDTRIVDLLALRVQYREKLFHTYVVDLASTNAFLLKKLRQASTFHFMYRVKYYFDVDLTVDPVATELLYLQAVDDVLKLKYPIHVQDAHLLAALSAYVAVGTYFMTSSSTSNHRHDSLSAIPFATQAIEVYPPDMHSLTSRRFISPVFSEMTGDLEQTEHCIQTIYNRLHEMTRQDAILSYLDIVMSWKLYGATYFSVETNNPKDFPPQVILAVGHKSVVLVEPESRSYLAEHSFSEILTWGYSFKAFVIVKGSKSKAFNHYFNTEQGKEISEVVRVNIGRFRANQKEKEHTDSL